jgi:hypothetical protein
MKTKSVLYAAVGVPVVLARKAGEKAAALRETLDKKTATYTRKAEAKIEELAAEGEKVVARIEKGKVVEEIQAKVDLDQAKEQVSKLRDQLEDMLATWKASFRPEKEAKPAARIEIQTEEPRPRPPRPPLPRSRRLRRPPLPRRLRPRRRPPRPPLPRSRLPRRPERAPTR